MSEIKKIILAEDNLADVELTKLAFKELGLPYEFVHVFNGQELINYVEKEPLGSIILILLDLNMPRLGGLEVLKYFYNREALNKLPMVVFSSSSHDEDIQECYEYGANAYVCKPLNINDFTKTIRSITNFWGEVNVLPAY